MTWVRLDDAFFRHPKALAAGARGRALYLASLCHCAAGLTDGHVSDAAVPMLLLESGAKRGDISKLIDAGMWEKTVGGYEVHNYLKRNPDAETVRERRQVRAHAGSIGGKRSGQTRASKAKANGQPKNEAFASTSFEPPLPNPPVTSSSVRSAPHPQPVDNECFAEEQPLDPVDITIRAVLERAANARVERAVGPDASPAYRQTVIRNLATKHEAELRRIIGTHPDAPVDVLTGHVLGESNGETLARYRKVDA